MFIYAMPSRSGSSKMGTDLASISMKEMASTRFGWIGQNKKLLIGKHREDGIIRPALRTRRFPRDGRDSDEHAAYATAA
jgi:hypothetical protein